MIVRRRAVLAGLAVLPLVLLSACKDDGSSPFGFGAGGSDGGSGGGGGVAAQASSVPHTVQTPPSPSDSTEDGTGSTDDSGAGSPIDGYWTGSYSCPQGDTQMRLTVASQGSDVTALFGFEPNDGSGNSGLFELKGQLTGVPLKLNADHWIEQPDGYDMVDMTVDTVTSSTMSGTIDSEGCTGFHLAKQ